MTELFDAIVIGTGQAGPSLAGRLSESGMKVAIVERGKFGGTCVNTGCIPTKTLVGSAYAARMAQRAREYGVVIEGAVRVDMMMVKARKDQISGKSSKGVEQRLKGLPNCTVVEGHGRFESARTVRVGDRLLEAEKIFINVGGRAAVPAIPGLDTVPFLNNSSMMDVDYLPEHLVIVGGGYVGLEFGQAYRRFGSRVTILEGGSRLVSREDPDISSAVAEILRAEGIDIRTEMKIQSVEKRGEGIAIGDVVGSHLLVATGRVPNTHDLGLDKAGVATDPRGYIVVDDQLRTSVPNIWALGDCNGRGAFTHTAYNDFEIAADNLLKGDSRKVSDRIPTYAMFIDPPLGRCGLNEADIRKSGVKALVAKFEMKHVSRAIEKGETQGVIKLHVDAESKLFLGAAILGTGGDEIIHVILEAMYAKTPCTVIERAVHIHPTVTEFLPSVLAKLRPL